MPDEWPEHDRGSAVVYTGRHDATDSQGLSTTVARALVDIVDDADQTDRGLVYDAVDPDALNRLFAPKPDGTPRRGGYVVLWTDGYRVEIRSDGAFRIVEEPDPDA